MKIECLISSGIEYSTLIIFVFCKYTPSDFVGRKTVLMAEETLDKNHSELTGLDTKLYLKTFVNCFAIF